MEEASREVDIIVGFLGSLEGIVRPFKVIAQDLYGFT
jgi:hypothetical protein